MRTLVVFDIDGTLISSNELDSYWYVQALTQSLDGADIDEDWTHYPHVTDQVCTVTLFERLKGRVPTADEVDEVRRRFIELLRGDLDSNARACCPVPGAVEMLSSLTRNPAYAVCLATGAWRDSAMLKLRHAGFGHLKLSMTSSSDAVSREAILTLAMTRARAVCGAGDLESVVSVGDAVWDVWAAQRLGLRFVGIGEGERASRLLSEGAAEVVPDYRDQQRFLAALPNARLCLNQEQRAYGPRNVGAPRTQA